MKNNIKIFLSGIITGVWVVIGILSFIQPGVDRDPIPLWRWIFCFIFLILFSLKYLRKTEN